MYMLENHGRDHTCHRETWERTTRDKLWMSFSISVVPFCSQPLVLSSRQVTALARSLRNFIGKNRDIEETTPWLF